MKHARGRETFHPLQSLVYLRWQLNLASHILQQCHHSCQSLLLLHFNDWETTPAVGITLPKSSSHHLPKVLFSQGSSSDSDSKYLPDKVFEKITKLALKRKTTTNCFALDFLHIYHDLKVVSPLLPREPPLCPIKVKKHKEKRAKARKIIAQGSHLLSVLACSSPTSV